MEAIICQHCGESTPSEYNFCVGCEKQIRCLDASCGKAVYPGKDVCFGCGSPLVGKINVNSANNHLIRKVKQSKSNYEEYTELSVSDNAVGTLAPLLGAGNFMPPPPRYQPVDVNKRPIGKQPANQGNLFSLPQGESSGNSGGNSEELHKSAAENGASESTEENEQPNNYNQVRFFEVHDDSITPTTKDFKGQSWAEQQNNFFILYTNSYHRAFDKPIPDGKHLRTASESIGIIDKKNFSRHLEKFMSAYTMAVPGGFKLNDDGQREYKKVSALMENEDGKAGLKYWVPSSTPAQSPPRISDADKAKVSSWLNDDVDLGELDIRMLKSPSDYVLLTLWIVTKHLSKAEAVTNGEAFFYLLSKYSTVSIEPGQFRAAFVNNKGKLFNLNKSNNTWFLTPEGEERVKSWISGQAKTFKKKPTE